MEAAESEIQVAEAEIQVAEAEIQAMIVRPLPGMPRTPKLWWISFTLRWSGHGPRMPTLMILPPGSFPMEDTTAIVGAQNGSRCLILTPSSIIGARR